MTVHLFSLVSTQTHLPRITEVVATGNKQAMVTFELTSSIKPLISTLKLIYGQSLDTNALTLTIPPESIPEGAPGNITAAQLSQINVINYQFKLQTVIGLYTYESEVVFLYPSAETTTAADGTTTDAVNNNDTTTVAETTAVAETETDGPTTTDAVNRYYTTTGTEAISTTDEPTSFSAPTITQIVATGSKSILVIWSKLDGASGYVIRYFNETGNLDGFKSVSLNRYA